MKTSVADFDRIVYCVRIEPITSAPIVRIAGYPVDLVMSNGEVYRTENGYEFSSFSSSSTFSSGSVDLSGIMAAGGISRDDIVSGLYDNARVYLFATNWDAPIEDQEELGMFFFGKVELTDNAYKVQLMGAIDVISQSVGRSYAPTCQWTLFDQTLDGRVLLPSASRCSGPRAAPDGPTVAAYKVTGTITHAFDQYTVRDSARTEPADWFGYGAIRFTSGPNAGLKAIDIKAYDADGTITLHEALFYMPQVTDAYEMIPGCRKRIEDCRDKFANSVNFGGQPHVPAPSVYSQVGRR